MLLSLSPIALRVASLPRIFCISSIQKQNDYTQLFIHSIIVSLSYLFRTMLVSVIASRTRREIAPNFTECIHSSSHLTHSTKHYSRCLGYGSEQNKDPHHPGTYISLEVNKPQICNKYVNFTVCSNVISIMKTEKQIKVRKSGRAKTKGGCRTV